MAKPTERGNSEQMENMEGFSPFVNIEQFSYEDPIWDEVVDWKGGCFL